MANVAYIPLSSYLSDQYWPIDFFKPSDMEFLEYIAYKSGYATTENENISVDVKLAVLAETVLELPLGFALVLGEGDIQAHLEAYGDSFVVTLDLQLLKLRLPRSLFVPVIVGADGKYQVDPKPDSAVEIPLNVGVKVDSDWNIELLWPAGATVTALNLPLCMLGNTGIVISAENIVLRLSQNETLPQGAGEAGLTNAWKGLFLGTATLHLPEGLASAVPNDLKLIKCFIGTGGFSGEIDAQWQAFNGNLAGFKFQLTKLRLQFIQNALTASAICGKITLPFFDAPVNAEVSLTSNGDFTVGLIAENGHTLIELNKNDLFNFTVTSASLNRQRELMTFSLSGQFTPLFAGLQWPKFDVKALTLDSQGQVNVDGGWLNLPQAKSMSFYGAKLEVTKLGFGTQVDGYHWIGMSGGIQIVEGIPLKGSVEGLKLLWKEGATPRLEVTGIGVGLKIDNVLEFAGEVVFLNDAIMPGVNGFKGGVRLTLETPGLTLNAQMSAGKHITQNYNFFYIAVMTDLPVGIPLAATGLSIYGLEGLFGYNMLPDKRPEDEWFEKTTATGVVPGFYKKDPVGITPIKKWMPAREGLAFGAGIMLGTAADNGYTFSTKALLVVLIPGPVILVEGKATFLEDRKNLNGNDEPPFRMLAVFDNRAGTFLLNVEASYKLPGSGSVIDIAAGAEVFFSFNDPGAWHIYLGQDTPQAKRIRAQILSLFQANAFFMLSGSGIAMGAWVGYDADWEFGPLRVYLQAWMEGKAALSWCPVQAAGSLAVGGKVGIEAFGIGIGLTVYAGLAVKTPNPFFIRGEFQVALELPWPLPDIGATVVLQWEGEKEPPPCLPALAGIGIEHLKVTEKWLLNLALADTPVTWQQSPIVPLDAVPVITFSRAVTDNSQIANNAAKPDPLPERVGDYQFKYELKQITLEKRPIQGGNAWQMVAGPGSTIKIEGMWQVDPNAGASNLKLMLWVNTPFDLTREMVSNEDWIYNFIDNWPDYPCNPAVKFQLTCVDFESLPVAQHYFTLIKDNLVFYASSPINIIDHDEAWVGTKKGLTLYPDSPLSQKLADNMPVWQTMPLLSDLNKPGILYLFFPELINQLQLFFAPLPKLIIQTFDKAGSLLNTYTGISANQKPIEINSSGSGIKALKIWGQFTLVKICYLTATESHRVESCVGQIKGLSETLDKHWGLHWAKVLEPNYYYKLTVTTVTSRAKAGSQDWQEQLYENKVFFQTANPPGCYQPSTNAVEGSEPHYPKSGPLKDLTAYIDYTIPATQAANERQIPTYRAYDVGIKFNEAQGYIEQMYLMAELQLAIAIYDNNEQPVKDAKGNPMVIDNQWGDNPETTLTREEQQWQLIVNSSSCGLSIQTSAAKTSSLVAGRHDMVLAAQTLHRAKLFAKAKQANTTYLLHQFSFMTSRYATFVHHQHSFEDRVWEHTRAADQPPTAPSFTNRLTTILAGIPTGSTYQSPQQEAACFNNLIELFKLPQGQFPEKVEVQVLKDQNTAYGLLLSSPEPLQWERLAFKLKFNADTMAIGEAIAAVKILAATSPQYTPSANSNRDVFRGDYNQEWIDILLRESLDVTHWTIQIRPEPDQEFKDYYVFKNEGILPAGTVLRIHSGSGNNNWDNDEKEHRYCFAINSGTPKLMFGDKVTIRLLDATGSIIHERGFNFDGYKTKDALLVRNLDQSQVFIFLPGATTKYSELLNGIYRLEFTFDRQVADKPILKRAGSALAESTYLEFSL